MRYLILGLGFLATHIAEYLTNQGEEVTVTYRNLERVKSIYAEILKARLVRLDPLNNIDELRNLIASSDIIVNTIGVIGENERELKIAHVEIPKKISEIISELQAKPMLIHISAASATGLTGYVKEEEKHCEGVSPNLPYEKTKCEGEKIVYAKAKENDFPLAIIRPTFIYGKYGAHVHFVLMYWLARLGIIPSFNISFSTISAKHIAILVKTLAEAKPKGLYMYAHECKLIELEKLFELMAKGLGREKTIKLKLPTEFIPSSLKCALKYVGTQYDCSKIKELIKDIDFDETEVIENALFLDNLRKRGMLLST